MRLRSLCLELGEVPMQFWLDQHDPVQEFLHDRVLVAVVRLRDGLELYLRVLVHCGLRTGRRAGVLRYDEIREPEERIGNAPRPRTP